MHVCCKIRPIIWANLTTLKHILAISAKFFEILPPFHLLLTDAEKKRFVLACCRSGELVKVI